MPAPDHIALVAVQQFERVGLVAVIVLAEHQVFEVLLLVHERQGVELVVPDDVVGLFEGGALVAR